MVFNDENFMLKGEASKKIYNDIKDLPIFDFHCHLDPQEIYENKPYKNIVDLWLGDDHYKWRLMRANGIEERYITGDASDEDKFKVWIETLSVAIGNPLYHWSHLEIRNVFGINEVISKNNWKKLYNQMNSYLQEHQLSPRDFIKASKVKFIGTTDYPLDDLEWHKKLAKEEDFDTVVAPTFRPDEVFVDHLNFNNFVDQLAEKTGTDISGFSSFIAALEERIEFFVSIGAKATDLSLNKIVYVEADERELDEIFTKTMKQESISESEAKKWQTEIVVKLSHLYKENDLVTQIHFGARRNNHSTYYEELGPDTGFDSIEDQKDLAGNLNALLDRLVRENKLPKMIWYNLNPMYNNILANTLANFQANNNGIKGQLQFGSGWWYNDTKAGMIDQMNKYAEQGILANFVGMLTDSRSFLSYQRHDYFRRILSSYIGKWIDNEEIPDSKDLLLPIIKGISYKNAKNFFE